MWNVRKGLVLRVMVFLLSGAIIGGLALAVYSPLSAALDALSSRARQAIIELVETQLAGSVSYSSIAPSIFSYIEVRDFSWQSEDLSFQARRIRIYYSLFDILAGNLAASPRDIRVEDGLFTALLESGAAGADPSSGGQEERGPEGLGSQAPSLASIGEFFELAFPILDQLPADVGLSFRRIEAELKIDGQDLTLRLDQGELENSNKSLHANLYLAWGAPLPFFGQAQGSTNIRLSIEQTARRVDMYSMFGPTTSEAGNLGSINFQTTISENGLSVVKTFDSRPFDVSLRAEPDLGGLQVEFLSSEWKPSSFFDFSGLSINPALESFLDGNLSGQLEFTTAGAENVSYTANLSYLGGIRLGTNEEPGRIQIIGHGDEKLARIDTLLLDGYLGSSFSYTGDFNLESGLPLGTLLVDTGNVIEFGRIHAKFRSYKSQSGNFEIVSESFDLFGLPITEPRIIAQKTAESWILDLELPFDSLETTAPADRAIIALSGQIFSEELIPDADETFNFELAGQNLFLSKFGPLLPALVGLDSLEELGILPDAALSFSSQISGTGSALSVNFNKIHLQSFHPLLESLVLSLEYADALLHIHSIEGTLEIPDIEPVPLSGQALVSLGQDGSKEQWVKSTLFLGEERRNIDARFAQGEVSLSIDSNLEVLLSLPRPARAKLDATQVYLEADGFTLPRFLQADLIGPIRASGAVSIFPEGNWSIQDLSLNLDEVRVPGFENELSQLSLEFLGGSEQLSVENISFVNGSDSFLGSGMGVQLRDPDGLPETIVQARIINELSRELITLDAKLVGSRLSANLLLSHIRAQRLGLTDLTGDLGISISLLSSTENLEETSLSFVVDLNALRYKGDLFQGQVPGLIDGSRIFIQGTEIFFGRTNVSIADAFFNFRQARGDIDLRIDKVLGIAAALDLSSMSGVEEGSFEGLSGRILVSGLPDIVTQGGEVEVLVQGTSDGFEFLGGPNSSLSGSLSLDGNFAIRTNREFGIALQGSGTIIDGEFDVNFPSVEIINADLDSTFNFGVYRMTSADLAGNLRLSGAINDPAFYGLLRISQLRSSLEFLEENFVPVDSFLIFEADKMYIPETIIDNHGAIVTLEGEVGFQRWLPRDFRFVFDISRDGDGLAVSHDFSSVVIDGMGSGTVILESTPNGTSVSGELIVEDASVTLSPSQGAELEGDDQQETLVNFAIHLGRGVEFFWPTKELPIFRLLAEQGSSLDFGLNSGNNTFHLLGEVPVRGGELYYPDRNYYLQEGIISFNENQDQFNPRVSLSAEARTRWQDQRITLLLTIDENYLDALEPRISSTPAIPQQELAAIVGGSFFPGMAESNHNILGEALLVTTDVISQFGIFREFETSVRNSLGLDVFSIRTGLFQNILRDIVLPDEAANYQNLVGRYFANTTIQFGKILGEDVFMELMLEVGETNPAFPGAVDAFGLSLNPEFRIEWQTPFFLIEWNWAPTDAENLFVADQRLTFSWDFY